MIKTTFDCDPSLVSPNINYVKLLIKRVFVDKKIKDAELSCIFCNDNFLLKLKNLSLRILLYVKI